YTSRGLGPGVGFVTGWTLLLDYLLIPLLMYVVASTALSSLVPEVPPWAFAVAFVAAVTFVNVRGIALTDIVNRVALVLELLVLAVFVVLGIRWLLTDPASRGSRWTRSSISTFPEPRRERVSWACSRFWASTASPRFPRKPRTAGGGRGAP
ncbi:MAG: amino acid permease, partial [Eggerthellaceae bacterium]